MINYVAEGVGVIGALMCLAGYYLIQSNRISADNISYILLNMFGALGIIFSLIFNWNLASFIMEMSWFLVSLYGLISTVLIRKEVDRS